MKRFRERGTPLCLLRVNRDLIQCEICVHFCFLFSCELFVEKPIEDWRRSSGAEQRIGNHLNDHELMDDEPREFILANERFFDGTVLGGSDGHSTESPSDPPNYQIFLEIFI